MEKFITRNWLILAVLSLFVGFWVAFAEDFVKGKAYMFFILAMIFGFVWLKKTGKM
ncbi:MAG: hypothetical protein ACK4K9_03450 [Bacteroidia bacterium]